MEEAEWQCNWEEGGGMEDGTYGIASYVSGGSKISPQKYPQKYAFNSRFAYYYYLENEHTKTLSINLTTIDTQNKWLTSNNLSRDLD